MPARMRANGLPASWRQRDGHPRCSPRIPFPVRMGTPLPRIRLASRGRRRCRRGREDCSPRGSGSSRRHSEGDCSMNTVANALVDIDHEHRQPVAAPAMDAGPMTPMQMAYHLIQNGADLGAVKEMLAMSKELAADAARREFEEAVASAKAEIQPVHRNAKGHNDKRYADFAAYAKAVDPIISKYGLSYRFRTTQTEKISVTCILAHKAGHFEENTLSGPADSTGSKNAIQAIGSTLTYLQRYTLIQALGLAASNDDDGKTASQTIDNGPITEEQAAKVRALIEETGTDIQKFCAYLKVESVPDITVSEFPRVIAMLEKKKGAK
ncbi:hypothetical protein EN802_33020 [bacterium M00.F.Ca.ET.159.01.1.1]|nr:hypothetical protein EN802_33020 [bacterium M00.F.Ca.ET.159.01.1.1]TGT79206.1 hypothetical protein EN800_32365 [bacterium M00.F.Ca.ET.157.01.1.1]